MDYIINLFTRAKASVKASVMGSVTTKEDNKNRNRNKPSFLVQGRQLHTNQYLREDALKNNIFLIDGHYRYGATYSGVEGFYKEKGFSTVEK